MNKLDTDTRIRIVQRLVEGVGINAICRMTGAAKNTVLKLLADLGAACAKYHDEHVAHLLTRRVQCDEVWSFVYAKQKNVPADMRGQFGVGDIWTWTAIDADTKLMISWMIGLRDAGYAKAFMRDVAHRLARKVQLTTDGLKAYLDAVDGAFGGDVDYAQLVKIYGPEEAGPGRYSPPEVIGSKQEEVCGTPEPMHVSTSFVERQNLSMRMGMRQFTRLTNAHSKKTENHAHAIALYVMHYNYCKIHSTLRVTPAMAAGLSKTVWEIEDLLKLID
ncbi:MAG TPA: DDE-type integrase/transposase/recombinase [Tepidisphaeraceae bacterium]|jgi:IS1 family transposase|nr:DDE-type integrase/transposase/recombinase [Tepidisphaeraceae bacterium]